MFFKQKVVASFASAEKIKTKLKERYTAIEKKRQEEEVCIFSAIFS